MGFVGLALLYHRFVPFFEKPDELKHFAVIQHIQHTGTLPIVKAGVYQPWDQEGTQPPLYHLVAAAATSWLDLSGFEEPPRNPHYVDDRSFVWRERGNNNLYLHAPGDMQSTEPVFVAAHIARLISLLAGVLTLWLTYTLARLIFESEPWLAVLSTGLIAFMPQFLHVSSAITNDSLTVTLAAAALVLCAHALKHGVTRWHGFLFGLVLGLGVITKLSLLYLVLIVGPVLLLDVYRTRDWRRFFTVGVIIAGVGTLLSGWWVGRNWLVYGDVTALNAHLLYRGGPLDPRPTLADIWRTEITGLELSFWGAYGAGQILLEPWLYSVLQSLKYVVGAGLLIGVVRLVYTGEWREKGPPLLMLLAWCVIIFVALLRWMQITPASWGRLLFPTLPALGVLAAWSLMQFGLLLRSQRMAVAVPVLIIAGLLSLAAASPWVYLRAAYEKTPLLTTLDANYHPLDLTYANGMHLLGYRVEKQQVMPGEWLPVTLYWQATQPITRNDSVFVHAIDHKGAVIGQANTYPDGGNWPTSLLPPGEILPDTYHVPIAPDANAPTQIRLAMGLFNFDDPTRAAQSARTSTGDIIQPIVPTIPLLPSRWEVVTPTHAVDVTFGGQIRLVGYDGVLTATESISVTLHWAVESAPGRDLTLFIHLIDTETGQQVAGFDAPPAFPTRFWEPGSRIADARHFTLPTDLPPGTYDVLIGWYAPDTFVRLSLPHHANDALRLATITITQTN